MSTPPNRRTPPDAAAAAATPPAPHVVIVGAGFGGLYAARALAGQPVRVTVVDRQNYHLFTPLLYQVATAALSAGEIAQPIRAILRHPNVDVVLAEAVGVDLPARRVRLRSETVPEVAYDYLILATGAHTAYFGHRTRAPLAPGLKTLDDALEIRRRLLSAFETADREPDPAARAALLTFVVVGGGPTGVELAGAIAEIARQTLRDEYRSIDPATARVLLLEAGPRLLPGLPGALAAGARRQLERLGVEVRTRTRASDITPLGVRVIPADAGAPDGAGELVPARTALWTAGVAASPLTQTLGVPLDRAGRILVEPDLTLPGHPEVYAVGDAAAFRHQPGQEGRPLAGVSQVAMQQGRAAAANVLRSIRGEARRRFRYADPGTMATVGRGAAVADLRLPGGHRLLLSGFLAWGVWLLVHLYWLIGFQNRLLVFVRWVWAIVTGRRGARLITGGSGGPGRPGGPDGADRPQLEWRARPAPAG